MPKRKRKISNWPPKSPALPLIKGRRVAVLFNYDSETVDSGTWHHADVTDTNLLNSVSYDSVTSDADLQDCDVFRYLTNKEGDFEVARYLTNAGQNQGERSSSSSSSSTSINETVRKSVTLQNKKASKEVKRAHSEKSNRYIALEHQRKQNAKSTMNYNIVNESVGPDRPGTLDFEVAAFNIGDVVVVSKNPESNGATGWGGMAVVKAVSGYGGATLTTVKYDATASGSGTETGITIERLTIVESTSPVLKKRRSNPVSFFTDTSQVKPSVSSYENMNIWDILKDGFSKGCGKGWYRRYLYKSK